MRRLAASLRPAALPGACRLLSAVAGAAPAAELKSLLRLLYLRVHPDLVARHKEAAEVNSRSFSSLQQWLALASPGEGEAGGFARAPVRVEFYVHEEDNAELRRVSLVLPPPLLTPFSPLTGNWRAALLPAVQQLARAGSLCVPHQPPAMLC